jgi:hypothetical protein
MRQGDILRITYFRNKQQRPPLWAVVTVVRPSYDTTSINVVWPEFSVGEPFEPRKYPVPQRGWVLGDDTEFTTVPEDEVPDEVWVSIAACALLA